MNGASPQVDPDDDVRVDPREWPHFIGRYDPDAGLWRRLAPSSFALFLIPNALDALQLGRPPVLVIALHTAYGLSYLLVWWLVWAWSPRWRLVWVGWLFAVGIATIVAAGRAESWATLGYVLSAVLVLLPLGMARWIGIVTVVAVVAVSWAGFGRPDWNGVLTLLLVLFVVRGLASAARTVEKLRAARSQVRELAVAGERARLARDLHDVLGHSLTTITVKTALARRLVESGATDHQVLEQLRDTEELSRRALADIRATVAAQRRMSLAAELVSARAALRAAGITADLPHAVDDVAAALEEPLAYVLREGITNVVRHSGAGRCTVRLGPTWLEVHDDGPERDARVVAGGGLTGLAERMAAVGGTLDAGPSPGGGFRLRAQAQPPGAGAGRSGKE